MQGCKYVCKNTWRIFVKVFYSTIALFLIYNTVFVNLDNSELFVQIIFSVLIIPLNNYVLFSADSMMFAKKISSKDLAIKAVQKTLPIIMLCILGGLIVAVGFLLLVIPGMYLMYRLMLSYPILLLENKSVIGSIKHSYNITKNSWWFLASASTITQIAVSIPVFLLLIISMLTTVYTGVEDKTFMPYILVIVMSLFQIFITCNILAVYYVMLWRNKTEQEIGILNG